MRYASLAIIFVYTLLKSAAKIQKIIHIQKSFFFCRKNYLWDDEKVVVLQMEFENRMIWINF